MATFEKKIPIPTKRKELRHTTVEDKDYNIAYDLAGEVYKKYGPVVLSVILFGSVSKQTAKKQSDIDLMLVVDNVSQLWDQEVISWYREELFNMVKKNPHRDRLHVTTLTLTEFWDSLRVGDPALINILRSGIALLDLGFFEPLKYLLYSGRIRPSAEAVYTVVNRTPWHLLRGRVKMLSVVEDYYWACVDSAHGALMTRGYTPPSPEHVYGLLNKVFVKRNKLSTAHANFFKTLYTLAHRIKNSEIPEIEGKELDTLKKRTKQFTDAMLKLTKEGEKGFLQRMEHFQ